jgi:hypothetical protein
MEARLAAARVAPLRCSVDSGGPHYRWWWIVPAK